MSNTFIEFDLGEDMSKAMDSVRQHVDQTRVNLPREIDPPIVQRLDFSSEPIMTYAVSSATGHVDRAELSWFIDDDRSRAPAGA